LRAVSDGHFRMSNEAPKKILIVEDEPTQRILAKEILESAGYIVRSSDDGKHGLNMAIKTQPDLIILDLMLPSLDGYALCTSLRECERTAQIPIILITGSKEPDVIKRGLAAGANDFVNKPVDWQFLADRVDFVLKQSGQRKMLDEELQNINSSNDERDKSEKEEVALRIQSMQQAANAASDELILAEEGHANAIKTVQAKAQDELVIQNEESVKELNKAREQYEEEIKRLTADFDTETNEQKRRFDEVKAVQTKAQDELESQKAEAARELNKAREKYEEEIKRLTADLETETAEQERRFDAKLQTIEERHAIELALINEVKNKFSGLEPGDVEQEPSNSSEELSQSIRAMWQIVYAECVRYDDVLSTITGLSKTRDTESLSEERAKEIAKHVNGLVCSVGRLKKLAIAMTEPQNLCQGVFETNEFISDLADRLKQIAARSGVSIEVSGLPNPLKVSAEPHRIRYALTLLSINALRFTPPSSAITVGASLSDAGDIRLSISDTGVGMSPAQLDRCTNCLDKPLAMPGANSNVAGLEIPIATALARQQGGYLEIESQQGQGTSVSLVLPVGADRDGLATESEVEQNGQIAC
jgi:DNA-binding response OmpR family regulator